MLDCEICKAKKLALDFPKEAIPGATAERIGACRCPDHTAVPMVCWIRLLFSAAARCGWGSVQADFGLSRLRFLAQHLVGSAALFFLVSHGELVIVLLEHQCVSSSATIATTKKGSAER